MTVAAEIQSLTPSARIELFVLDMTFIGDSVYYFHAGTNGLSQPITWQGQVYQPFPCKATGFDMSTNGQLPRPKLTFANVNGLISAFITSFDGCVGAKVTRKRTLKKYLDAVNFDGGVNPTADPTAEFPDDIFTIDRPAAETSQAVEFELTAGMDVAGVMLPRRQIVQNQCPWRYRGAECGYTGTNCFGYDDQPVGSASLDSCGKRLTSCKARFGESAELPFGGFPGANVTTI